MGILEIFLATAFFLIGFISFFSLLAAQSKDLQDYPEIHTVSLFLAIASVVFFSLSGLTVYLGLTFK